MSGMCEMFAILDGTVYQRFKEKNKRDVIKKNVSGG
jgi:hypothetical protein